MRHRVAVQQLDESVRDAYGQVTPAWVALNDSQNVFCEVVALQGKEFMASQTVQANVSHLVRMRRRLTEPTPKHRLVWLDNGNAVLNVVAVSPAVGSANMLEVQCLMEA